MPFGAFAVASLASAALWVGAYMGVGFVFSRQIDVVLGWMADHAALASIVVVGALLTYIGFKAFERYRLGRYVDAARITIDELRELLAQEPRPFVVDVGSRLAHQSRPHIPGARMLDLDAIARAEDFPTDQDIILYCACPNEESARRAAQILLGKGLKRVRPLAGGLDAWIEAGHTVEQGIPATFKKAAVNRA
jgi:rhodanese-related sulfurtransferase